MQGTYLMNGYSVFNVHVGINPTLTYRTVLAQKRNTHFEKNLKNFSEEQKSPPTVVSELHYTLIFTSVPLKRAKK